MKVMADGGNGGGGVVAVPLMRELGVETVEPFIETDGRFSKSNDRGAHARLSRAAFVGAPVPRSSLDGPSSAEP